MRITLILSVVLLTGCTFVQLSEGGAGVAQLDGGDIAHCKPIGVVSAQTRDKVVISRSTEDVREELNTLARNEAAKLSANAIVPIGIPEDGAQRFRAYLCE